MEDKHRTLHFNAPGLKCREIEIAPDIAPVFSKRKSLIESEDNDLDTNINVLDSATRLKNRSYQERLDDIWSNCSDFEAKLRSEAKSAVEAILNLKDEYQNHLDSFQESFLSEINFMFDEIDKEVLPSQSTRLDGMGQDVKNFFGKVIPDNMEKQSGEVSRQLRRSYETFHIEKKKEAKRETRLIQRANIHLQQTEQHFLDEDAFISSSFLLLENDIVEFERRAARSFAAQNDHAQDIDANLHRSLAAEKIDRENEDGIVLDTVINTQEILQNMVLMHFGTKSIENEDLQTS